MFKLTKSIDADFSHHVNGHPGACINIHGHTWKFEVCIQAEELDERGFVCDFKQLKTQVLEPCHELLDHGFALSAKTLDELAGPLRGVGIIMMNTRVVTPDNGVSRFYEVGMPNDLPQDLKRAGYKFRPVDIDLCGAFQRIVGGMKCIAFPFTPTSERLAEWLYAVAEQFVSKQNTAELNARELSGDSELDDQWQPRLKVAWARIYETLHPVHAYAEFSK